MAPSVDFNGRLLLIVDDDEHTRNLLRDLCESAGFRVVTAEDGVVASERIEDSSPDLVLLDLMMPRRDGFTVLRWVREDPRHRDLPVIILTAIGEMDGKIRGMELGADDYVTKPFKLVELQTRIHSALMVREYRRKLMDAEDELAQFRAVDPITGAGTYSQLKASADAELARSRRYGRPVACLMLGFDYQSLRIELGREASDAFVARLSQAVQSCFRGADRFFRMDTDQFVVLLPETDLQGAHQVAARLSHVVAALPLTGSQGTLSVALRIGGAVFPHVRVRTTEDLLREAHASFQDVEQKGEQRVFEVEERRTRHAPVPER